MFSVSRVSLLPVGGEAVSLVADVMISWVDVVYGVIYLVFPLISTFEFECIVTTVVVVMRVSWAH